MSHQTHVKFRIEGNFTVHDLEHALHVNNKFMCKYFG